MSNIMPEIIHWNTEDISCITSLIQDEKHRIVPIVGSDVFYIEQNGERISLQNYIIQIIIDRFIEEDFKEIVIKDCMGNELRHMKKLSKRLLKYGKEIRGRVPSIYSCIAALMKDNNISNQIKIDKHVKQFLQFGRFPLIITTCNIAILHKILVGPMGKNYAPIGYYCQKDFSQDIDYNLVNPTIFHLFGICESGQEPMVTEDDFLKYLHYLHSATSAPEKLKKYLQTRTILALGCNMPDWTFRFILHSLLERSGILCPPTDMIGGAVKKSIEPELQEFLTDISYLTGNDLVSVLTPINKEIYRPNLFLSYSAKEGTHEWDGIETIRKKLEPYFIVWFFPEQSRKTYGERYWDIILEGLEKCDIFFPIITKGMIERIQNSNIGNEGPINDKDEGFLCEWWMMTKVLKPKQRCIAYFLDSNYDELQKLIKNKVLRMEFLLSIFTNSSHISDSPAIFDPSTIVI